MPKIFLKPGREKSVKGRHPWLFSGAIKNIESSDSDKNGCIAEVFSANKEFLGRGFFNKKSSIAVRFLTFQDEPINESFWKNRLLQAVRLRQKLFANSQTNAYRLVHGEGDFLPGLVIDQYDRFLVLQSSTSGMDAQKELIISLLQGLLTPQGIYEKSDLPSRKVEGLSLRSELLAGNIPELVEIKENNLSFVVDIKNGQKTGFFLDQRNNRAYAGELAAGKRVLNCFCYSGGFSIYAGVQGAAQITNVDISPEALVLAKKNFSINSLDPSQHRFLEADGFTTLRDLKQKSEKFDLIILDPPAFAKNQSTVQQAARGYKDINLQAMQLMAPEGILVTCSCSQHLERMLFQKIVHDAAVDAKREIQFISIRGQAEDHPINAAHPEGEYLKCLVVRVI